MDDFTVQGSSVQEMFDSLERWGAGIAKLVVRDANDKAIRACIVIDDPDGCESILAAIEAVEESWARERGEAE